MPVVYQVSINKEHKMNNNDNNNPISITTFIYFNRGCDNKQFQ